LPGILFTPQLQLSALSFRLMKAPFGKEFPDGAAAQRIRAELTRTGDQHVYRAKPVLFIPPKISVRETGLEKTDLFERYPLTAF